VIAKKDRKSKNRFDMIKHSCHRLTEQNDTYHLVEIEQVDTKWFFHRELKANEKWVYDGEAKNIGDVVSDHKIIINFCPYCGEKLNRSLEIRQTDFHKQNAPEPKYPILPPENFFQCPEIEIYNLVAKERWFIVRDPDDVCIDGVWMLEKFTNATDEMVQMGNADYIGELCFISGFGIWFCPFCGELLDIEQASRVSSH
jgi:hypothetical protein